MALPAWYQQLTPEKQLKVKRGGAIAVIVLISTFFYYGSGRAEKAPPKVESKQDLSLGTNLLEDDIRTKVDRDLKNVGETVSALQQKMDNYDSLLGNLKDAQKKLEKNEKSAQDASPKLGDPGQPAVSFPPPPPLPNYAAAQSLSDSMKVPTETKLLGGIGHASGEKVSATTGTKKKECDLHAAIFHAGDSADWDRCAHQRTR